MSAAQPSGLSRRLWLQRSFQVASVAALPLALPLASLGATLARPEDLGLVSCEAEPLLADTPTPPVRLGSNENPYGPSARAKAALNEAVAAGNRYGYNAAQQLAKAIAEREGVSPEQVLVGAGSKDLLGLVALAYGRDGGDLVAPDPTYNFLLTAAEGLSGRWVRVPLDAQHRVDLEALARAVTDRTRLVYLCNPHNPIGTYLASSPLHEFAKATAKRVPVVIDEAYLEFIPEAGYTSAVPLVRAGHDVIVVRTFSKVHGMAGLRIGYLIATPQRVESLRKLASVPAMNLANTSVAAAQASLNDTAFVDDVVRRNAQVRTTLTDALTRLNITVLPSVTNFVAIDLPSSRAHFRTAMQERGFLVNDFQHLGRTWGRISIGSPDEIARFVPVLQQWWQG